ncbi:Shikimate dehydrogenase (NADP(+)) [Polaromonas vacuolata]|uniref:Shikimate dehydrogenase (NADP(+)) n=1 Tax=Polaromonas vacuolata TaxID=37448 RepID=A0A6H2HC76_9BURK|nr:shikimate dehydrogenase [Polaromonas vacuolata]QJC57478.1 Shikimate dehydrogenase (NADP(+)) [Polaromonas vacuolata]
MDKYLVLGNPIAHSKSPQIHARFAELTGQQMAYDKCLVASDGFNAMLAQLLKNGVRGCNVTVPFKFEAFDAAHSASARAQLAEAANTLVFDEETIYADNTDGAGLVADIEINAGRKLAGLDILLLGAGGAAAGVLGPLISASPRRLVVANRTLSKAQALVARHRQHESLQQALQKIEFSAQTLESLNHNRQDPLHSRFDVLINATASSLSGASIPVPASVLKPGALAYDLMYGPATQAFMDWARDNGAEPRDGLGMLVEQAAVAFELWRGQRPPAAQVLAEMRAALSAVNT